MVENEGFDWFNNLLLRNQQLEEQNRQLQQQNKVLTCGAYADYAAAWTAFGGTCPANTVLSSLTMSRIKSEKRGTGVCIWNVTREDRQPIQDNQIANMTKDFKSIHPKGAIFIYCGPASGGVANGVLVKYAVNDCNCPPSVFRNQLTQLPQGQLSWLNRLYFDVENIKLIFQTPKEIESLATELASNTIHFNNEIATVKFIFMYDVYDAGSEVISFDVNNPRAVEFEYIAKVLKAGLNRQITK